MAGKPTSPGVRRIVKCSAFRQNSTCKDTGAQSHVQHYRMWEMISMAEAYGERCKMNHNANGVMGPEGP